MLRQIDSKMAKILIVDDDCVVLDILSELVDDLGHEPVTARNGLEALELITHHQIGLPALVITDWMMPRLDGIGLIRALRAMPSYRNIPVMLTSASPKPEGAGLADSFLVKPFNLREISDLIKHYADTGRAQQALTSG